MGDVLRRLFRIGSASLLGCVLSLFVVPALAGDSSRSQVSARGEPARSIRNAASPQPLHLGVIPFIGRDLIETPFAPLVSYLEREGLFTVQLVGLGTYTAFLSQLLDGTMDLALVAPNLAEGLARKADFDLVARSQREFVISIVVHRRSSAETLADLAGGLILSPARVDLTADFLDAAIARTGLRRGVDLEVTYGASFDEILLSVLDGRAAAGAMFDLPLAMLSPELRAKLRILERIGSGFGVWVAPPHVPADRVEKLQRLLLEFGDTEEGQEFLERLQFGRFVKVTESDLAATPASPFVEAFIEAKPDE